MRRITRQSTLLHLPKVRTETAKRSFYYNGVLFIINVVLLIKDICNEHLVLVQ